MGQCSSSMRQWTRPPSRSPDEQQPTVQNSNALDSQPIGSVSNSNTTPSLRRRRSTDGSPHHYKRPRPHQSDDEANDLPPSEDGVKELEAQSLQTGHQEANRTGSTNNEAGEEIASGNRSQIEPTPQLPTPSSLDSASVSLETRTGAENSQPIEQTTVSSVSPSESEITHRSRTLRRLRDSLTFPFSRRSLDVSPSSSSLHTAVSSSSSSSSSSSASNENETSRSSVNSTFQGGNSQIFPLPQHQHHHQEEHQEQHQRPENESQHTLPRTIPRPDTPPSARSYSDGSPEFFDAPFSLTPPSYDQDDFRDAFNDTPANTGRASPPPPPRNRPPPPPHGLPIMGPPWAGLSRSRRDDENEQVTILSRVLLAAATLTATHLVGEQISRGELYGGSNEMNAMRQRAQTEIANRQNGRQMRQQEQNPEQAQGQDIHDFSEPQPAGESRPGTLADFLRNSVDTLTGDHVTNQAADNQGGSFMPSTGNSEHNEATEATEATAAAAAAAAANTLQGPGSAYLDESQHSGNVHSSSDDPESVSGDTTQSQTREPNDSPNAENANQPALSFPEFLEQLRTGRHTPELSQVMFDNTRVSNFFRFFRFPEDREGRIPILLMGIRSAENHRHNEDGTEQSNEAEGGQANEMPNNPLFSRGRPGSIDSREDDDLDMELGESRSHRASRPQSVNSSDSWNSVPHVRQYNDPFGLRRSESENESEDEPDIDDLLEPSSGQASEQASEPSYNEGLGLLPDRNTINTFMGALLDGLTNGPLSRTGREERLRNRVHTHFDELDEDDEDDDSISEMNSDSNPFNFNALPPFMPHRRRSRPAAVPMDTANNENRDRNQNPNERRRSHQSWVIYVIGGAYPPTHPIFFAPSLLTDNPTYEDMLIVEQLLGPVKPPVATKNDVAAAGGEFQILAGSPLLTERCPICLMDYSEDDNCRKLNCKHIFHQECVDSWLTRSHNSCPMCRHEGVPATAARPVPQDPQPGFSAA